MHFGAKVRGWVGRSAGAACAAAVVTGVLAGAAIVEAQARPAGEAAQVDEEARHLFEAGTRAFSDGRFEVALARFREAYELSRRPALLYNVGQAADRIRMDREALDAFERYLAAEPNAANRREVESRITALRRVVNNANNTTAPATTNSATAGGSTVATPNTAANTATPATTSPTTTNTTSTPPSLAQRETPTTPATTANPQDEGAPAEGDASETSSGVSVIPANATEDSDTGESSGSMLGALGWTSLGVGTAGLGVSLAALLLRNGEAAAFNGPECLVAGRTRGEVCGDRYDAGQQWESVALGALVGGGALVATGAVLLLLNGGDADEDAASPRAAARCAPQLGTSWGLSCAGTF
jgi:hypothetical protein